MKYEKRFRHNLKFSEDQLDKISLISALYHAIEWYGIREKDIQDLNPEWLEQQVRWRANTSLSDRQVKELKENGMTEWGDYRIRKTKKGYVLDINFDRHYNFKKIVKSKALCEYCKKNDLLNWHGMCEGCEKMLKKKRKYLKFIRGEL